MTAILTQRMTASFDTDEFVVFLIGARINKWWRIGTWFPLLSSMPKMIRELELHPELGFLGAEQAFGRTTIMVQYWRSIEHLLHYAKARDSEHLPVWRAFNRRVGVRGDVGIWHETYVVHPGNYENIYVNMPAFGLGRVGRLVSVGERGARRNTARERLRAAG